MPDTPFSQPGVVLVIEDERPIADLERLYLSREGFEVHLAGEGRAALDMARGVWPEVIVLDLSLPDMSWLRAYRTLRSGVGNPPVVLTPHGTAELAEAAAHGIAAGDVVAKPFSPRDLVSRVRDKLRQSDVRGHGPRVLAAGDVMLDEASRAVILGERRVVLTVTEFRLLAFLVSHPGRVFTRGQLLTGVWRGSSEVGGRTIDVHIAQIRAKLGPATPIRTVRGVGYAAG
ncbi:MAG: response regulator transcription factor [Streptosporangiaceae bacterium]